jgi:hypothetical protein
MQAGKAKPAQDTYPPAIDLTPADVRGNPAPGVKSESVRIDEHAAFRIGVRMLFGPL